ncbi:MAG: SBBP repeat-containing protein, partial [Acidobacteriota bacterium]|nr:SBBP repeat-containing protein [Acidobacteriota bacterium]
MAAYGKVPIAFEETPPNSLRNIAPRFLSRGVGYTVSVGSRNVLIDLSVPGEITPPLLLDMRFLGGAVSATVSGVSPNVQTSTYIIGSDPSHWRTKVRSYERVLCRDIYPGINAVFYGNHQQLEYDLNISPGANPRAIKILFEGAARHIILSRDGSLNIAVGSRRLVLHAPVLYQEINGTRQPVRGRYVSQGRGRFGFSVGTYNHHHDLVIDPILTYATYTGGSGDDVGFAVAADISGNAYVIGMTASTDLPTTANALQRTRPGRFDIFVTKFNGSQLMYSTYIGGSADDEPYGITLDKSGQAY